MQTDRASGLGDVGRWLRNVCGGEKAATDPGTGEKRRPGLRGSRPRGALHPRSAGAGRVLDGVPAAHTLDPFYEKS